MAPDIGIMLAPRNLHEISITIAAWMLTLGILIIILIILSIIQTAIG